MAVVPHNTKVLSLSPVVYYDFAEASGNLADQGSANADLVASGTPDYQETSLLKDGDDFACRIATGSFAVASGITTTAGYTVEAVLKVHTFPSSTMYPIVIGSGVSSEPYCWIGLLGAQDAFTVFCGKTGGFTLNEFGGLVVEKTYHVVISVSTTSVKCYIDGSMVAETDDVGILTLNDEGLSISTAASADFTIDEVAVYSGALSATNVQNLFKSVRAVDESATEFYVATDGDEFGTGAIGDPIDIYTSQRWPVPAGGQLTIRGGTYEPTIPIVWYMYGVDGNRISIKNYTGELARFKHVHFTGQILELATETTFTDLVMQDYAIEDGVTGIEVLNERPSRLGWKGNYPELEFLTDGTVDGTSVTTTDPDTYFHGPSHEGLAARFFDGDHNVTFETTVATVNGADEWSRDLTLADAFPGGEQSLSSDVKFQITGSGGYRYEGGGIKDFGQDNRIIGGNIHDVGDGVTSFATAYRTGVYYGIYHNLGWNELKFRDHAHAFYLQNAVVNGYKNTIGNIAFECGGSTGKYDSASGDADNFNIIRHISWGSGEHQDCVWLDIKYSVDAVGSIDADSDQLTYTNTTGTLAAGDRVRVKGAGWYGTDFFARVQSLAGGVATLSATARKTVVSAQVRSYGPNSLHNNGIFTGSSNYLLPSWNHIVRQCINLRPNDARYSNEMSVGYSVDNENCEVTDNYNEGGFFLNRWRSAVVTGNSGSNEENPSTGAAVIAISKRSDEAGFDWAETEIDDNDWRAINFTPFGGLIYAFGLSGVLNYLGSQGLVFYDALHESNDWQDTAGTGGKFVDVNSTFDDTDWTTNRYFLDPQDATIGLAGAGNLVIINRELLTSVTIDLSRPHPVGGETLALVNGQRYQIRDAELYNEKYGVVYDDYFDEENPEIDIPIYEVSTVANVAALPGTGTFGINYFATSEGTYHRWGTDAAYHVVSNPIPRTQPVGWTASEFSNLNPLKPERFVARIIPYNESAEGSPGQPTGLTVQKVTNRKFNVTWSLPGADETSVTLQRRVVGVTEWTDIPLAAAVELYVDTGVTKGSRYEYRVYTSNASGDSLPSAIVTKTLTGSHSFNPPPTIAS
jgi:hypothetical protein